MNAVIRAARAEDIARVRAILNDAIVHTTAVYDYEPRSLETVTTWFEAKQGDGLPVIVADREGEVVGFGSFGVFRPWAAYQFTVEHSLYVDAPHRSQGIGRQLLEALVAEATVRKKHSMIAGIDADNAVSLALHERAGFRAVGRLPAVGYKFERWLDLVFLQRML